MQQAATIEPSPFRNETDVFHERHEKSASALLAIWKVLKEQQPLKGKEREFIRTIDEFLEAEDQTPFSDVWHDPVAYFWVRIAFDLTRACLTSQELSPASQKYCEAINITDINSALEYHLQDFKRFILGIHILNKSDVLFDTPYVVELPFAIPGTNLALEGKELIALTGLLNGHILIKDSADNQVQLDYTADLPVSSDNITLMECPLINHQGHTIGLRYQMFNLPGLGFSAPVLDSGQAYQEKYKQLIIDSLDLVSRYLPDIYEQMAEYIHTIALKPYRIGRYSNITYSDLPGAFIASVIEQPHEFADTLIHEFSHDRLFFMEERQPFFTDDVSNAVEDYEYYSPWRDELRPLHGILHAVFVFSPVCRFWVNVYKDKEVIDDTRLVDYIRDRIVRIILQMGLGIHQLGTYGHFTGYGKQLFDSLNNEYTYLREDISKLDLSVDVPAYVCNEDGTISPEISKLTEKAMSIEEAIMDHVRQVDSKGQCNNFDPRQVF